jgi:hypothetical protein
VEPFGRAVVTVAQAVFERGTVKQRTKIVLSALVLVGVLGAVGVGTFATFNAQTTNPGNVFADGTLVLSNKVGSGTTCFSTGAGTNTDTNSNSSCDQLFNLSAKKPGDSGSANLTVKNEGSIAATALKVYTAACTNADASGETYHGTGLPCSAIDLTIQEYDSTFTTAGTCVYGGASCAFDDTKTLAAFQTSYNTSTNGLAIGSGLASGASKYLKVSVKLPTSAGNSYQGRQATADFTWYADQ